MPTGRRCTEDYAARYSRRERGKQPLAACPQGTASECPVTAGRRQDPYASVLKWIQDGAPPAIEPLGYGNFHFVCGKEDHECISNQDTTMAELAFDAGLRIASPLRGADLTIPKTFVPGTPGRGRREPELQRDGPDVVNSKQNRILGTCQAGQTVLSVTARRARSANTTLKPRHHHRGRSCRRCGLQAGRTADQRHGPPRSRGRMDRLLHRALQRRYGGGREHSAVCNKANLMPPAVRRTNTYGGWRRLRGRT